MTEYASAVGNITAFLRGLPLLENLNDEALAAVADAVQWFSLPGNWPLFREGDEANACYLVTVGGLGVMTRDAEGCEILVAHVHPGEIVGEMALISGEPRSASVVALRDTELLRLPKITFDELIQSHPLILLPFSQLLTRRLQDATRRETGGTASKVIALVPLGPDHGLADFAREFAEVLRGAGRRVQLLDRAAAAETTEWFHKVEADHDIVLNAGEPEVPLWTRLCLRQADRIVLVVAAGAPPPESFALQSAISDSPGRRYDMVLLHGGRIAQDPGARAWLERAPIDFHCHLRAGNRADLERLGRFVTGRAVGLVLSGGGARGFAHIGAIKALRACGVPLDLVGGTSMGGIIAAGVASEWGDRELETRFRGSFVKTNPINDYTLPLIALTKGRKVRQLLWDSFGDALIEDLWRPYFCVSANLTTGRARVHKKGPLLRALQASVAIPGVLPPLIEAGEVLVDGGVINNLPLDVMLDVGRGPVIGVDVAANRALFADANLDLHEGSLWWLLRHGRRRAPGIVSLLLRSGTVSGDAQGIRNRALVDLLLEPPLEQIDLLDWKSFDLAVEAGYRHAMEVLEESDLPARLGGAGNA